MRESVKIPLLSFLHENDQQLNLKKTYSGFFVFLNVNGGFNIFKMLYAPPKRSKMKHPDYGHG